jgi:hypothetical protein
VITWESFAKTGSHLFFLVIIFVNEFFWLFQGVSVTGFFAGCFVWSIRRFGAFGFFIQINNKQ